MNEKTILENPSITDKIIFDIDTPGIDGCFSSNPYKVDKVIIYFVSRDYSSGNFQEYEKSSYDVESLKLAEEAEKLACITPTEENIINAKRLRSVAENNKSKNKFHYKDAEPIHVVGDEKFPAWLSTDTENAFLTLLQEDDNGNPIYGKFKYVWEPKMAREGDYFICWTWTPLPAGDSLSAHTSFSLSGNTQATASIPTHYTNPKKYKTLLEKYLPEVFKTSLSNNDISAGVLDRLNNSIASGFNVLEDLANQIVDLQDSNSLHEFLIPYLGNYFGLKLKSDDPTKWRKQIKRAVPIYKKKGTRSGVTEALENAGIQLNKISQLWQVVSSYTWQESFMFSKEKSFYLEKNSLDINEDNFELWLRPNDSMDWVALTTDYISLTLDEDKSKITWVGDTLPADPIELMEGDEIKFLYQFKEVPDNSSQNIEDYIRKLDLMDTRDTKTHIKAKVRKSSNLIRGLPLNSEFKVGQKLMSSSFPEIVTITRIVSYSSIEVSLESTETNQEASIFFINFEYPPKNWNTRVIPEDDPMFNVVLPNRHPFFDPLIYGKVRTEFPYSENVYNMDEYNGSLRDSKNPCDIDKSFVDPCHSCMGSSYNIDLELEELSDNKIIEAKDILKENMPFHAVLHTLNFLGSFDDFVPPPEESVEMLMTYSGQDFVVSGNSMLPYFYRIMLDGKTDGILRSELSSSSLVYSGSGVAYNDEIILFCPDISMSNVGASPNGDAFIEIKSPSSNQGVFTVFPHGKNTLKIGPNSLEPIDVTDSAYEEGELSSKAFTFDLNNQVEPLNGDLCNIQQNNIIQIFDEGYDFSSIGIKTKKDVENGLFVYSSEIQLSYGTFEIKDILPDGSILLDYDSSLPTSNSLNESYSIIDNGEILLSSGGGRIHVIKKAIVTNLNSSSHPVQEAILHKRCYQKVGPEEYLVDGIVPNTTDQYFILDYDQGDMNGVNIDLRQKLIKDKIGYLSYNGFRLQSSATESSLGITNGANYSGLDLIENDSFKENFIVLVNRNYYWINEINDDIMILGGPNQYWTTTGTNVNIEIYKYEKLGATIKGQRFNMPGHSFKTIDRSGRFIISSETELANGTSNIESLSKEEGIEDKVQQQEEIYFDVEYKKENNNE